MKEQELIDALKEARERAETYRKSRNHFRESRDQERKNFLEIQEKITDNHNRVVHDLNHEIQYFSHEVNELEGVCRNQKAMLILSGVIITACLTYIFLIC